MFVITAAIAATLLPPPSSDLATQFGRTCAAAKSKAGLVAALGKEGWKPYATVAESHVAREIAAVTPMLEAQGLASDYTIYWLEGAGAHLEVAISETKKPLRDDHKLIGCSMYDFTRVGPIDDAELAILVHNIAGQKSSLADVSVEKWESVFGPGSGMRAVFVPTDSPMKDQLGFAGMMLGSHFLDGAN